MSKSPAPYRSLLTWLVVATFTVILNETIMLNAIPRLMEEFDVTARDAQWLSTGFMLAMAVVIPVTGWFLQRVTTRTAFLSAMLVFCAGTLLAALAWSFPVLVAARIVQACGTAIMMPLLMTTLMMVVPENERGGVMGNVTLAMSVAPAMGPTVSGLILQSLSWRWLFIIVLPIAITVTVLGLRKLENVGEPHSESLDWPSVALAAFGFGGFVYGLSQIGDAAATAVIHPAIAIPAGALIIAAFVWRQRRLARTSTPLLDLDTLRNPTYRLCLTLMGGAFMAMLGAMILLPLYLQDARELSVLKTGLLMMPGGLAMGLLGPTVGRWFDRLGARPLVIPGAIGMVLALGLMSQVSTTMPYVALLALHMTLMVSLALLFTPIFTIGLGALTPELYSHGSSLLGTLQQLAAAGGTALVITVFSSRQSSLADAGKSAVDATVGGMQWAFALTGIIALGVLALSFRVPGKIEGVGDPVAETT